MPIALLSVSDKTGIVPFARGLHDRGWKLLSTGGTARALRDAGVPVTEVSDFTGHPEIMDGRVKTLHPAVHSGLLGRRGHPEDEAQMAELGYSGIDLLAVNLYPFRETIARPGVTDEDAIENIDIGGPAMLRSAAKNHASVWVVVDPSDYERVLVAVGEPVNNEGAFRRELAAKVYGHTSSYDAAIAAYLERSQVDSGTAEAAGSTDELPGRIQLELEQVQSLRYGENPGQNAGFYRVLGSTGGLPDLRQLHGKELSFNNLLDVDGALLSLGALSGAAPAACAIVKHTTPCGLAVGATPEEAYGKALSTDPTSAFGSIVAFDREVSRSTAELLRPNFVEAIVAPGFSEEALELLREKKNIRLLVLPSAGDANGLSLDFKGVPGGFLVQTRPRVTGSEAGWSVASARKPTESEMNDLRFAWRGVAVVKSNAILIARDGKTLGIGAGQMSRVDSSRIAVMKALENGFDLQGAVLASDAFFPFRDGVDAAAGAGITAIIQPGGSVRDEEVIAAANEHGLAMVFTGNRLFRH
ncbi:MAG: bifunctional phosphoribosylaminoimidazolecarboxamide formyltransferase/IMP cyclohydrolase [Gemmatimonadota bacterium]|jgi:phosphoribosylaminoimidazolecarboxamide formyltransferase/IMP cyclohydrolase|nr:bifunctional phosphoribosylaminoimidazolecarboxamide formyltransferase/IMP cyclohydrolase [Gemmatimonadota bacterium]